MTALQLFYYPYASFTNEQLPLLKVAALIRAFTFERGAPTVGAAVLLARDFVLE